VKTIGGKFSDSEVEDIETFCTILGITRNDLVRSAIPFYIRAMKVTPFEIDWVYKGFRQLDPKGQTEVSEQNTSKKDQNFDLDEENKA
jgi:hypothetical protein